MAQADWWLIAARAVQGIGAGVFLTASLSSVSSAFPPDEQSKGIGVWAGVGVAVGSFVGGFLTEVASWRWFFFVNIPIALLAVFLTLRVVRESRDETTGRHVDLLGLVTVTAGLTALVLGIQQSETLGWGSPFVIGMLMITVILLSLFVFVEPRLSEPPIALSLVASRGNLQAGRLASAIGPRLPIAGGMALIATAFLLLAFVAPTSGLAIVVVALVIAGVGQSLAYTISTTAGMGAITADKARAASGVLQMVRQVGVVFGVAVSGALFKVLENSKLAKLLAASGAKLDASDPAEIRGLLSGSEAAERKVAELAPALADQVERVVHEAFVYAFDGAMVPGTLVSAAGLVGSFLVARGAPQNKNTG